MPHNQYPAGAVAVAMYITERYADRVKWLWDNRNLIGGLEWVMEPPVLRFFYGRLKEIGHWQEELVNKFKKDFGDSL